MSMSANSNDLISGLNDKLSQLKRFIELSSKSYGQRRPMVIEFSGTPKSGKSTTLRAIETFLRKADLRVRTVVERASVCPLQDKEHFSFNVWTGCQSLIGLIEGVYPTAHEDCDVVILDRGLFDVLTWVEWLRTTGRILDEEASRFAEFFTLPAFARMVDLVLFFSVRPEVALRREALATMRTEVGRIMNHETLKQYNDAAVTAIERYGSQFPLIKTIDSTDLTPDETIMSSLDLTMEMINSALSEKILCVPKLDFISLGVDPGLHRDRASIDGLMRLIDSKGLYRPRGEVEQDFEYVQVISCLVLRRGPDVFLLRRSEPNKANQLHDQYVVWAGGHVREEDRGGNAFETAENALRREIEEELHTKGKINPSAFGVVYDTSKMRSQIHVGMVYTTEIGDAEVALSISQREFKERRGTSLSGTFQSPSAALSGDFPLEAWSAFIVNALGGNSETPKQQSLI